MNVVKALPRSAPFAVSHLLYPTLFFSSIAIGLLAIWEQWSYGIVTGALIGATALTLIALEARFPAKREWRMTLSSFLTRDLKYMAAGIATGAAASYAGALIALFVSGHSEGTVSRLPLYLSVPLVILIFDFVQYWVHRWMHETNWPLGDFLWRVHAGHHLPDAVYVLMHPAGHPLNDLIVRQGLNIGLVWFIGFNTDTVLIFTIITATSGLFSHFNLDVRAGFLNYLFVSTELHRYHHSASPEESGNFGVVTPFWDILFGTFVYRPGQLPERIGVDVPSLYPLSRQYWQVFLLPFRRGAKAEIVLDRRGHGRNGYDKFTSSFRHSQHHR